jgi:hypothetical protein
MRNKHVLLSKESNSDTKFSKYNKYLYVFYSLLVNIPLFYLLITTQSMAIGISFAISICIFAIIGMQFSEKHTQYKDLKIGLSWTFLCFMPLVSLARGQFVMFTALIGILIAISFIDLINILNFTAETVFLYAVPGMACVLFCFHYANGISARQYIADGWKTLGELWEIAGPLWRIDHKRNTIVDQVAFIKDKKIIKLKLGFDFLALCTAGLSWLQYGEKKWSIFCAIYLISTVILICFYMPSVLDAKLGSSLVLTHSLTFWMIMLINMLYIFPLLLLLVGMQSEYFLADFLIKSGYRPYGPGWSVAGPRWGINPDGKRISAIEMKMQQSPTIKDSPQDSGPSQIKVEFGFDWPTLGLGAISLAKNLNFCNSKMRWLLFLWLVLVGGTISIFFVESMLIYAIPCPIYLLFLHVFMAFRIHSWFANVYFDRGYRMLGADKRIAAVKLMLANPSKEYREATMVDDK